jgi:hypothetical protein
MECHLQKTVFRIVALAASGAREIAAPGGALAIVVLGNGERRSAAAWDQEHAERALDFSGIRRWDRGRGATARRLHDGLRDPWSALSRKSLLLVNSARSGAPSFILF